MTAKERAELVVAWMKKQEQENFYLGTLEMNLIAEFEAAEREAWNEAIEAALDVCERMRERFVILEQDEKSSYQERHDNGTSAVSLMQATNAIKSLLK